MMMSDDFEEVMNNDEMQEEETKEDEKVSELAEQSEPVEPTKRYNYIGDILNQEIAKPEQYQIDHNFSDHFSNWIYDNGMKPMVNEDNEREMKGLSKVLGDSMVAMGAMIQQNVKQEMDSIRQENDKLKDILNMLSSPEYQHVPEMMDICKNAGIPLSQSEAMKFSKIAYVKGQNVLNQGLQNGSVNKTNIPYIPKGNSNRQDNYTDQERKFMKQSGITPEAWDKQKKRLLSYKGGAE